nr:MAG TPA: hypothetical protein [Caudoviricetes sp.]
MYSAPKAIRSRHLDLNGNIVMINNRLVSSKSVIAKLIADLQL